MGRTQADFQDILEERRQEFSHLPWVNRKLDLLKSYMPEKNILPSWHKSAVENSKKVQDIVAKMKRELGSANVPVLYLPSHRSYADFILMSYVLFTLNIEIPAIAAGMDFHGMVGMGKVLRDTGAFFMRRSYNSDDLYWDIFKQYVLQIVTHGNTGIEFFIEGTRSRSGKSLPPKFGLLSMILKAFLTGDVYNLLIVPINISYERIMEENLFAFELLGVPKPAESTSGFFKALKILNEDFGSVHIDFGAPISVRDLFQGRIDRSEHVQKPVHLQEFTDRERYVISDLAERIVNCQQRLTVLSTFNIIAIILNHHLVTSNSKSLPLNKLSAEVLWFCSILTAANVLSPVISNERILEALKVHNSLVYFNDKDTTVGLNEMKIVLDSKQQAKMKGHILSDGTMSRAIPAVKLQIYINPALLYVVDGALIVIILSNKGGVGREDVCRDFQFLRKFLGKDFVYPSDSILEVFNDAILFLTKMQCIESSDNRIVLVDNKLNPYLVNLIHPFLFTYNIVCNVLLETALQPCSEKAIFVNCQSKLEQIMQQEFVHPYCLNLDGLSNCRSTLIEMDCLKMTTKDGNRFYCVDAFKMKSLLTDIDLILGNEKYKLHINNKL